MLPAGNLIVPALKLTQYYVSPDALLRGFGRISSWLLIAALIFTAMMALASSAGSPGQASSGQLSC